MKAFNVDNRTLDYTDKNENHYILQLRGKINIVKRASGTGKTYLAQALKYEKKSEIGQEKRFDNIVVIDHEKDLDDIQGAENSLIIIDRADRLIMPASSIADYINTDTNNNTYLIFARGQIGIAYTPNYVAEFIRDDKQIGIKYLYNVRGWF